jgi:hypothetical protein
MVKYTKQAEYEIVLAICQEADVLVATDTGVEKLEVLETLRMKMNDALLAGNHDLAVEYAEIIGLRHAGFGNAADALEYECG